MRIHGQVDAAGTEDAFRSDGGGRKLRNRKLEHSAFYGERRLRLINSGYCPEPILAGLSAAVHSEAVSTTTSGGISIRFWGPKPKTQPTLHTPALRAVSK